MRSVLIFSFALFSSLVFAQETVLAKEKMWIIRQKSKLLGDLVVYVSTKGVRIDRPRIGSSILALNGQSKVTVYNRQAKRYSEVSVKDFETQEDKRLAMLEGYLEALKMKPVKARKTQNVGGLTTCCYELKNKKPYTMKSKKARHRVLSMEKQKVFDAQLLTAKPVPMSEGVQAVVHSVYKLPKVSGLPVSMKTVTDTGTEVNQLATVKVVAREADFAIFKKPGGMQEVSDYAKVLHSSYNLNRLMHYFDMIQDSNLGK